MCDLEVLIFFFIANLKLYYLTLSFIICLAFCSGEEHGLWNQTALRLKPSSSSYKSYRHWDTIQLLSIPKLYHVNMYIAIKQWLTANVVVLKVIKHIK